MSKTVHNNSDSGFSLVETLIACALLVGVLLPAFASLRANLDSARKMAARLDVEKRLETFRAETEYEIYCASNVPLPLTVLRGDARLLRSEAKTIACGNAELLRYSMAITSPLGDFSRETLLFAIFQNSKIEAEK